MESRYSEGLIKTGEMLVFILSHKFGKEIFTSYYEKQDSEFKLILKSDNSNLLKISEFLLSRFGVIFEIVDGSMLIIVNKNIGFTMTKISNYFKQVPESSLDMDRVRELASCFFPAIKAPNFSDINLSQEGIVECSQYICDIVNNSEKFALLSPVIRNDILELSKKIKKFVA